MHNSAYDIPKSQTKLQGVEHTQNRQMFIPIYESKVQKDTTLLGWMVCLSKQKIKEICETNYYRNEMSGWYLITLKEIVKLK